MLAIWEGSYIFGGNGKMLQKDHPFPEGGFFGGNGKSIAKGAAIPRGWLFLGG